MAHDDSLFDTEVLKKTFYDKLQLFLELRGEGCVICIEDLAHNVVVLVLAFRRDVENTLASNLVLRPTPGLAWLAFCFASLNITEKYIPKRVGARTQPCFTPFTMEKGSDIIPSTWAVPCMFSWNDLIRSSKIGGHPTFLRIVKSASRFT